MNKYQKIIMGLFTAGIAGGAFFLYTYLSDVAAYKSKVATIVISDIDLSKVNNGTYYGSCDASLVAAEVSVSVKDNKINDITLVKHKNDKGQKAEVILQKVLKAQSLKVDTVTGATNSSKVILKAIETALKSANNN